MNTKLILTIEEGSIEIAEEYAKADNKNR